MRKSERKTIFVGGEIYLLTRGGLISVWRDVTCHFGEAKEKTIGTSIDL
jgi:hypothetical protein